jgi:hypothetical protein
MFTNKSDEFKPFDKTDCYRPHGLWVRIRTMRSYPLPLTLEVVGLGTKASMDEIPMHAVRAQNI